MTLEIDIYQLIVSQCTNANNKVSKDCEDQRLVYTSTCGLITLASQRIQWYLQPRALFWTFGERITVNLLWFAQAASFLLHSASSPPPTVIGFLEKPSMDTPGCYLRFSGSRSCFPSCFPRISVSPPPPLSISISLCFWGGWNISELMASYSGTGVHLL